MAECAQDTIRSSVRICQTKRCVSEIPVIRARSGVRRQFLCTFFAPLRLLARRSPQALACGRRWPQARGAGPMGNLMGVSGVLPRLLGRSVLAAKMGMVLRRSRSKSRLLLPPPVALPAVLRRGW